MRSASASGLVGSDTGDGGVASRREAERAISEGRVTVNGEVVREVAVAMSVTPKELADGVATARGARAIPAMFALSTDRLAVNMSGDLHFMATQAGVTFEGRPTSWVEAAGRIGDIVERFARSTARSSTRWTVM